jgi:ferritin-like metal-binding protein YciE
VSELFKRELEELLRLERRLLDETLPEMRQRAHAANLRAALDRHILETRAHVDNLERVLLLADSGDAHFDEDFEILASILRTEALEAASYTFLVHAAAALGVGEEHIRLLRLNMEQDEAAGEHAEHALAELLAEKIENAEV